MRRTLAILCGSCLFAGTVGSGCSSTETARVGLASNGAPDFQQLYLAYDVDTNTRLARLEEPLGVRHVSHTEVSTSESKIHLRLELASPYPGVHPDFVHATLRVITPGKDGPNGIAVNNEPPQGLRGFSNANSRGGGLMSGTVGPPINRGPKAGEELLAIDIPKPELQRLFVDLANDSFFTHEPIKGGESHLDVSYNQGRIEKVWNREPRLEQLIVLLRRYGTPTFAEPAAEAGPLPGYYTGRNGKS